MRRQHIRVLLVEDNTGDARLLEFHLGSVEDPIFTIDRVDRLSAARERLRAKSYDVVLLDLSLPDSRGTQTVVRLYEQAPHIPIVVLTGLNDEATAIQAVQEGAQDYLFKGDTANPSLLARAIRYAIERHRLRRELRSYQVSLEEKVRRRTDEIRAVFALSPDGFVSFDGHGRLVYVNRRFFELFQLRERDMLGQTVDDVYALLRTRFEDPDAMPSECGASERETTEVMLEIDRPVRRFVKHGVRRVLNAAGQPQGTIMYFQDVTHLTLVDRMKTQFLNHASHELRTPLTFIVGYSELLLSREKLEGRAAHLVERILHHGRSMAGLVHALLDLSRIEARRGLDFKWAWHPANELARRAVESFSLLDERHSISLEPGPEQLQLYGDREKIEQVLTNLLSNAIKYSPAGGQVRVCVGRGVAQASSRLGALLTVQDQGLGMTQDQMERAFDRFWRADESGTVPGTGLGLSLVKEFVEVQRGEVWLDSELGGGTRVSVWLPSEGGSALTLGPETPPPTV